MEWTHRISELQDVVKAYSVTKGSDDLQLRKSLMDAAVLIICRRVGVRSRSAFEGEVSKVFGEEKYEPDFWGRAHLSFGKSFGRNLAKPSRKENRPEAVSTFREGLGGVTGSTEKKDKGRELKRPSTE